MTKSINEAVKEIIPFCVSVYSQEDVDVILDIIEFCDCVELDGDEKYKDSAYFGVDSEYDTVNYLCIASFDYGRGDENAVKVFDSVEEFKKYIAEQTQEQPVPDVTEEQSKTISEKHREAYVNQFEEGVNRYSGFDSFEFKIQTDPEFREHIKNILDVNPQQTFNLIDTSIHIEDVMTKDGMDKHIAEWIKQEREMCNIQDSEVGCGEDLDHEVVPKHSQSEHHLRVAMKHCIDEGNWELLYELAWMKKSMEEED